MYKVLSNVIPGAGVVSMLTTMISPENTPQVTLAYVTNLSGVAKKSSDCQIILDNEGISKLLQVWALASKTLSEKSDPGNKKVWKDIVKQTRNCLESIQKTAISEAESDSSASERPRGKMILRKRASDTDLESLLSKIGPAQRTGGPKPAWAEKSEAGPAESSEAPMADSKSIQNSFLENCAKALSVDSRIFLSKTIHDCLGKSKLFDPVLIFELNKKHEEVMAAVLRKRLHDNYNL